MNNSDGTLTTLPDGRVVFTRKRPTGAPPSLDVPVPGALGEMLCDAGYVARIVIERGDGSPIGDYDREAVSDMTVVATEMLPSAFRDRVFLRRVKRGDERANPPTEKAGEVSRVATAKPSTKPRKRAAARRI